MTVIGQLTCAVLVDEMVAAHHVDVASRCRGNVLGIGGTFILLLTAPIVIPDLEITGSGPEGTVGSDGDALRRAHAG